MGQVGQTAPGFKTERNSKNYEMTLLVIALTVSFQNDVTRGQICQLSKAPLKLPNLGLNDIATSSISSS